MIVRSMNQGKWELVKQEIGRGNIDILGISELKWTGMDEFNPDDNYIYYCGQESIRRKRVALIVNKRVWNAVLGCTLKNDRMISVGFQGKPFNITVIQVYAPTSNAEEAEIEWFYEDLWASLVAQRVKASACNVGDLGSIPGLGRSPGRENSNPLQYSCLENSLDGEAWWAIVHGATKSRTRLSDFNFTMKTYKIL